MNDIDTWTVSDVNVLVFVCSVCMCLCLCVSVCVRVCVCPSSEYRTFKAVSGKGEDVTGGSSSDFADRDKSKDGKNPNFALL